ncbi:MAG: very short patch repair endonuclease [Bdellovibrionales bacterium]|nr:very short patch repair endonuclease [Bdellovibrionales bacterium]
MTDTFTRKQRHYCMSQIKSKNTKPEIAIRKLIWKKGYRYRIGHGLMGKPDMVFPFYGIAVFIDGCFWHGCSKNCRMPSSNVRYWKQKISGNKKRDKRINRQLKKEGWKVIRIWEHDIKKNPKKMATKILNSLLLC